MQAKTPSWRLNLGAWMYELQVSNLVFVCICQFICNYRPVTCFCKFFYTKKSDPLCTHTFKFFKKLLKIKICQYIFFIRSRKCFSQLCSFTFAFSFFIVYLV